MLGGELVPQTATNLKNKSQYIIEDENIDRKFQNETNNTGILQKSKIKQNSKRNLSSNTVISSGTNSQQNTIIPTAVHYTTATTTTTTTTATTKTTVAINNNNGSVETKIFNNKIFNLDQKSLLKNTNNCTIKTINLEPSDIDIIRNKYRRCSNNGSDVTNEIGCKNKINLIANVNKTVELRNVESKNNVFKFGNTTNLSKTTLGTTMLSTHYTPQIPQTPLPQQKQLQQQSKQLLGNATSGGNNVLTSVQQNINTITNLSSNINNSILTSDLSSPVIINTSENQDNNNSCSISNNNNNNNSNINNKNNNNNNNSCKTSNNNNSNNNNSNNYNNNSSSNEASGRSAALERAYVHDVYENCEEPTGPIRPRVAQFLAGLEPGSIVCDVGCGNGRYLTACNPYICTIGVDRCYRLAKVAKGKGGEVALCDNLELPFRDESFDAVLSLAVVHHFATTERRVGAIRELARILRIGGRVIISVWALEQRHRRFESQDVLIPWQPPKSRTVNYSDEEDEDEFLPPYHAYTEDSTNSSRSAGDGDSSSLSSSSPGESCYSFVRRAIQKLAGGRKKHPWFLDSWTSKETKNDSSLDYEDAKDLPIELRRLEDFEDFPDPPLSAGLKSRSLGSILNPPPRQIVRSRSSVPSLGGAGASPQFVFPDQKQQLLGYNNAHSSSITSSQPHLLGNIGNSNNSGNSSNIAGDNSTKNIQQQNSISPTKSLTGSIGGANSNNNSNVNSGGPSSTTGTPTMGRRPKLIKQKQSLCDDDFQLPDNPFHMLNNSNLNSCNNGSTSNLLSNTITNSGNTFGGSGSGHMNLQTKLFQKQFSDSRLLLRKQSSLNEELMAENRLREKERVRKRIQKQMSLNEAFLCRSVFTKRLQIIREGFTTKLKTSTGSLERVTKNSLVKIMKNFQSASQFGSSNASTNSNSTTGNKNGSTANATSTPPRTMYASIPRKNSCQNSLISGKLAMQHCITAGTHYTSSGVCPNCNNGSGGSGSGGSSNSSNSNDDQAGKPRRHSRESGSDSSKDSSLQSDTSIESEDSFASVIFIPKPEGQQQQQQYQHHKCTHTNVGTPSCNCNQTRNYMSGNNIQSVPTSPLIMPCPPTPAHSPAALNSNSYNGNINSNSVITSPPLQLVSGMLLSPPNLNMQANFINNDDEIYNSSIITNNFEKIQGFNRFTFDEAHILAQQEQVTAPEVLKNNEATKIKCVTEKQINKEVTKVEKSSETPNNSINNETTPVPVSSSNTGAIQKKLSPKITRQSIKDLPPIPKFRKNHSMPIVKTSYPIVRRSSASPALAKLQSLEIFNPATDDLDSDSSEPSSPDSIDSVIDVRPTSGLSSGDSGTDNTNKSTPSTVTTTKPETTTVSDTSLTTTPATQRVKLQHTKKYHSLDLPTLSSTSKIVATSLNSLNQSGNDNEKKNGGLPNYISKFNSINRSNELIKANQELLSKYSNNKDNLLINNLDIKNITSNSFTNLNDTTTIYNKSTATSRQELIDFAEQLSAQLLKRLDADAKKAKKLDDSPPQPDGDSGTYSSGYLDEFIDDPPYTSKSSHRYSGNDARDLADWREELRERRLNLANLSTQTSQRQSPISSSTSSLSSQTGRSYTIHEEDEDVEAADSSTGYSSSTAPIGNLYENRNKNLKYKRTSTSGNNYVDYRNYSIYPETAYLIQDGDGDSLSREEDDPFEDMDTHNVIPEEDEEDYDRDDDDDEEDIGENGYSKKTTRNTIRCQESSDSPLEDLGTPETDARMDNDDSKVDNKLTNESVGVDETTNNGGGGGGAGDGNGGSGGGVSSGAIGQESWVLTNSSNSLDSPSQSGGSTTHHRYYHVFREGELDALINHHVTSLHIVSSYYERASWCVVAEKVQVWTI